MNASIRIASASDAASIAALYNHYIKTTCISFEQEEVSAEAMAERISEVNAKLAWYVAEKNGQIVGYAYATPWRARSAYRFSVETSVYIAHQCIGQGLGKQLYQVLLDDLRHRNVHTVIGGIAQPNPASVALHEKLGFEKVAHFKEVGYKFDQWIDVAYWQLALK
ncbi:MAG: GNAT family N-acetyltransferase [Burkholderiaceae bacterium]|nr:GNAT family N-acetyltransferase [Burkholderiaceae bacterium]